MSPAPYLHELMKRHDTGLGLSESPPQSTGPPQQQQRQQQQQQQQQTTRPRSASPSSSIKSDGTTLSTRPRFHEGLLMPDATPDPHAKARHAYYRRRVHKAIFNDIRLDWRSAPVVCDEKYDYTSLLYRRDLRCKASPQYLLEIRDELRRKAADAVIQDPGCDSGGKVVCVDGEEMIDMIG